MKYVKIWDTSLGMSPVEDNLSTTEEHVRRAFALTKERQFAEAARYYELAAEDGSALAQHNLATMYKNGQGVQTDIGRAIFWFEKAAEQGDVDALFNLALICDERDDLDQSFSWFARAAEAGSARAQYDLAVIYQTGKGRAPDLERAIYWYEQAANQGVRRAEQALQALRAAM